MRLDTILVAFDGSPGGQHAFAVALDLASKYRAALHVCSVIEALPRYAETMSAIDDTVDRGRAHFELLQRPLLDEAICVGVGITGHIQPGHPVETIVDVADQVRADCIVVGGLGHSRILHRTSGGTGAQVAYHARCSVLIARARSE